MSAAEERWDVVVVGLHDPSPQRIGRLAATLADSCGMAPTAVSAALEQGEVPVYAGLRRHEAELAASELDRLGAAVDLRMSIAPSGAYPILRPDAERRSGTAVGGFIDDSATPPRFAGSGVRELPLEPEPSFGGHRGPSLTLEAEPSLPRPPVVGPSSSGSGSGGVGTLGVRKRTIGADMAPAAAGGYAPPMPPAQFGVTRPASGSAPDALTALSHELDRLTDGDADSALGTIDGSDPTPGKPKGPDRPREFDRVASRPSAAQRQAARDARAIPDALDEPRIDDEPDAAEATRDPAGEPAAPPPKKARKAARPGPPDDAPLELDFAAAGLARTPIGGIRTHEEAKAGQSGAMLRQAFGPNGAPGSAVRGPEQGEPRPLLGPDRTTATLFGLALGLGVGLVVTVFLHKGVEQDAIAPLEAELQSSLMSPAKVQSGEVRNAAAIEKDLESAYGDVRRSFFAKWLLIGVPLGLIVGRGNRRG